MKFLCIGLLSIVSCLYAVATSSSRPNIVLILCDDLGYSDVGFNGCTDIQTPELDKLASQGTVFSSGYVVHPFCGPSRMGLMSGRYPHEFGAPFNLPNPSRGLHEYNQLGVPTDEILISTVLRNAGYHTGAVGKWHMGMSEPYHPNNRGFDEFFGFLGGGHFYFPEKYQPIYERQTSNGVQNINEYVVPLQFNGAPVKETEYLTDALSREAVRFVQSASGKRQPFFLYLAYNAPHSPLEAKPEDLEIYSGISDKNRRIYAAMVHAVDRGVGRVVDALKETGAYENTLIVFLSDNGGKVSLGATNTPLRAGKGSTYEGGYRVPMLFHWPRGVPQGQKYPHPVSAIDFYPTFAGLAGAAIPDGKELDGKNIWRDFLAGNSPRTGEMLFAMRHQNNYTDIGARMDQWKLARVGRGPWQLFNVDKDMAEENDLSNQYPERLQQMVRTVRRWSLTHTTPRWFHDAEARDAWLQNDMPNYDQDFSLNAFNVAENIRAVEIDTASDTNVQPLGQLSGTGYNLAWSDEFNGSELDENKWGYRLDSKHWSTQLPRNITVSDGILRVYLRKEQAGEMDYTGGGIISNQYFRYGYYEARIKCPEGAGWHTSFWMMDNHHKDSDTSQVELDPLETNSIDLHKYSTDYHQWRSDIGHMKRYQLVRTPDQPLNQFHVYGMEWTAGGARFFFNGEPVRTAKDLTQQLSKAEREAGKKGLVRDISATEKNDVQIWFTSIATWLGNTEDVDDTVLPSTAECDYIRFFAR